jgi:hypothetical protein
MMAIDVAKKSPTIRIKLKQTSIGILERNGTDLKHGAELGTPQDRVSLVFFLPRLPAAV